MGDHTVVCQVEYSENFTRPIRINFNRRIGLRSKCPYLRHMSGWVDVVSNCTKHDQSTAITCLEILIKEVISIMPDVNEILFFSDAAASQLKNRYVVKHLTTMMDANDVKLSWNYFASSHGKRVLDGVAGILKRLVWTEIMAGVQCSSAQQFVDICCRKKTKTIVGFVQQAQFDATRVSLHRTF